MTQTRPPFPPGLGVAVAVASVSFAAPLFRLAQAPALTASFWRLLLACLLLLPFSAHAWSTWKGYARKDWLVVLGTGLALAVHFALWVLALFQTTVAAATALVTLQAVFVALGGHFVLKDRLGARAWAGVAIALCGALALALTDARDGFGWSRDALLGDALALLAGVCSAAYMLIGRRLRATRALVEYVLPVYASAALALAIGILVLPWLAGWSGGGGPLLDEAFVAGLDGRNFLAFVLLAAVPMLGGHTVANWTLRYLPAHTVAAWILLEPVGAALLAWPILGEIPEWGVAAWGLVVLAGAWLTVPRTPEAAAEPAG